jgi:hypothetical protein
VSQFFQQFHRFLLSGAFIPNFSTKIQWAWQFFDLQCPADR